MLILCGFFLCTPAGAKTIRIVAAENFYGSVAKEIGGSFVQVKSILSQPNQDPHLFNITPSVAKEISQADLIVYNGLGYDLWMQALLNLNTLPGHQVICVGQLLDKKIGANPHIWYDPTTMPAFAEAVRNFLTQADPLHQALYRANYQKFIAKYTEVLVLIQQLKAQYQSINVIATEPVFNYMAQALGFKMQGIGFQISIMNGIDPTPRQLEEFQNALQSQQVKILFYNKQVQNPLIQQLLEIAKIHFIPIIGITETQPTHKTYTEWMSDSLDNVRSALQINARSRVKLHAFNT
jgi:zinc/manganese transport system substrate-binding protein